MKRFLPMMSVFSILLFLFLYAASGLQFLHSFVYDVFYEHEDPVTNEIVIVGYDDEAYEKIGRWPIDRSLQAELFGKILADGPAVLGIDNIYDATTTEADDQALVNVLRDEPVVLGAYIITGEHRDDKQRVGQFPELDRVVTSGYMNANADPLDTTIRRTVLSKRVEGEIIGSLGYEIYATYHESMNLPDKSRRTFLPTDEIFINFLGPPGSVAYFPATQLLNDMYGKGFFEDKIVLFGPYTVGMQDGYMTPLDKEEPMFGVEIHANIVSNLISGNYKVAAPFQYNFLLILLAGLGAFLAGRYLSVLYAQLVDAGLIAAVLIIGKVIYEGGSILEIIYPLLLIVLLDVLLIAFKYFEQLMERRRITGIFGRYVAPQVVAKILEEGEESLKLGGVSKEISVLFVDIRGFTPLSEMASPSEIVEILNEYLELCSTAVFNHSGTLDKFIGDGTMAIYNAPLPLDDHGMQAIRTAWEMKGRGEELSDRLRERFGREVRFGIGINTGDAIVGNIGASTRMDYTAIGDTVNIAARLESNAKPGQILISQATYDQVKNRVRVEPIGPMKVKGKQQLVTVYAVEGLEDDHSQDEKE